MTILTTRKVIPKLEGSSFCYAKQRNMLFVVHNPEASRFYASSLLGLKNIHPLVLLKTNVMNNPSTQFTESDTNGYCSI